MARQLEVVAETSGVWPDLREEAARGATAEPGLGSLLNAVILAHGDLASALSFQLARKLGDAELGAMTVREICAETYDAEPAIVRAAEADLRAVLERDPAAKGFLQPFLFYKGFLSLQTHRVANRLWRQGRETLAWHLQSRMSELFQVDIHPAAKVGSGVFIDHATGVVIGETTVVADDVSILQSVTLGGNGKESGDRHPKIARGVLLSVGAKVLGNVRVGEGAKIGAAAVVLSDVPAHTTVAGVPARVVSRLRADEEPALSMDQSFGFGDGI